MSSTYLSHNVGFVCVVLIASSSNHSMNRFAKMGDRGAPWLLHLFGDTRYSHNGKTSGKSMHKSN